ncbi:MAG: ATP-grasp domain-containing protein [Alkaliphilus sp.]
MATKASKVRKNILVTSISKKAPLLNCVSKAHLKIQNKGIVFGADTNENCIGKYFVDYFWKMPMLTELALEVFIRYCSDNDIKYIIPTRDGELAFFALHKKTLKENGIYVMCSDYEPTISCLDKLEFYRKCAEKGFNAIETVENISNLDADKYAVKEKEGAGAESIGLNLTREQAIKHSAKLKSPIFQPFIIGTEYSVDIYIGVNGKVKGVVARSRDLVINGESQITTTTRNSKIEDICAELAEKLNLYGHIVMQILEDNNGDIHIIECNCRFGGASSISVKAGLYSFYWFLLESNGENLQDYPFARTTKELRQIRYPEDLVHECDSV